MFFGIPRNRISCPRAEKRKKSAAKGTKNLLTATPSLHPVGNAAYTIPKPRLRGPQTLVRGAEVFEFLGEAGLQGGELLGG